MQNKIKIGVTAGDLNGIGLEVFAKYLSSKEFLQHSKQAEFFFFCDHSNIKRYFEISKTLEDLYKQAQTALAQVVFVEVGEKVKIQPGVVSKATGKYALESFNLAIDFAINGKLDGIITLPICKESIKMNLPDFSGHTEHFANYFTGGQSLMMFVYQKLRVALLTNHLPIQSLTNTIDSNLIVKKSKIFYNTLKSDFLVPSPKIAILGLNPHAGENGNIGKEEVVTFMPAIKHLQSIGIKLEGPFPADGFFAFGLEKQYDGILACYHDQGLIPFKLISKGKGVNFTANLPVVRCSPDHGTAFDIVGKGIADYKSLANAFALAIRIVKNRKSKS